MDKAIVAFLGEAGWFEKGRCTNGVFSYSGPGGLPEEKLTAKIRVDLRPVLNCDNPFAKIWKRPNLDLSLPDNNVRHLFEGCIGNEGSVDGHEFDGNFEALTSSDSLGLNVYLDLLEREGAIITGR